MNRFVGSRGRCPLRGRSLGNREEPEQAGQARPDPPFSVSVLGETMKRAPQVGDWHGVAAGAPQVRQGGSQCGMLAWTGIRGKRI